MRTLASLLTNWRKQWPAPKNCAFSCSPCWAERDRFATHLYQSREYRRTSERAKAGKSIERCGISTFQIAQAWIPWRVSRLGTPPPGRMTASGRRGCRFSTQEYQYRTVHCTKQSPCASALAQAGRIPFQCDFDKCALWRLSRRWNVALSAYKTGRSAGLDLAVIRLCGTQQTIYFTAGNHDPPALSNRFD